jgi:imidazolonepropionase-like amidohydrolase
MKPGTALLLLACFGAAAPVHAQRVLVLRDVTVLPMTDPRGSPVHAHQTVIVRGERIVWVGANADATLPADAAIVEGAGLYVLPGLADMHVHTDRATLPLFLANGVTTIRELNGSPALLALRDSIAARQVPGPRMFVSSPLLVGEANRFRHLVVTDADTARALVRRFAAEGYDLIKIYDGLARDVYNAIVAEARVKNLPCTGHIPQPVGLDGILGVGQNIEHVEKIVYATIGVANPDTIQAPVIAQRIAAAHITVTPTLVSQRALSLQGTTAYAEWLARPEVARMDSGTLAWWRQLSPRSDAGRPQSARAAAVHIFQKVLTRELYKAGVQLLVGTDTPNPLMVPGYSLHDEIASLIDAGIPVAAVLRAATAGAAEHMRQAGQWGVLAPGASADLVLVGKNPLDDPAVLRRPTRGSCVANGSIESQACGATEGAHRILPVCRRHLPSPRSGPRFQAF